MHDNTHHVYARAEGMAHAIHHQTRRYMSKRQRPCDACRARKSACRIERAPPCRLCRLSGRECTFNDGPPPRPPAREPASISAGSSINSNPPRVVARTEENNRGLALALNSADSPTASIGNWELPEFDRGLFPTPAGNQTWDHDLQTILDSIDPASASLPSLAPEWQPSTSNMAEPSSTRAPQIGKLGGSLMHMLGLSGDMDPFMLQHYRFDDQNSLQFKELTVQSVQNFPRPGMFLLASDHLHESQRAEAGQEVFDVSRWRALLEKHVGPDLGKKLINLFWRSIQPQFPLFAVQEMPDPTIAPPHLLAAVYAVSLPLAVYDDCLSVDTAYDQSMYPDFFRIIHSSLDHYAHSADITVPQTLILLLLRPSSTPTISDVTYRWTMHGTLISHAMNLGFHQDPSPWSIPDWQIAQRRRLSFLVHALDKWLACVSGRPPYLHHDNWLITVMESRDRLGSGLGPESWARLQQFSTITGIVASVLAKFYSVRATSQLCTYSADTASVVQSVFDQVATVRNVDTRLPNVLVLACLYVELITLRGWLRPWFAARNPSTDLTGEALNEMKAARARIMQCATELSQFVRTLSPGMATSFWPSWNQLIFSTIFHTQMTMAIACPNYEDAAKWIQLLMSTRESARQRVNLFPQLRLGLLRVDSLFWRGIDQTLRLEAHVEQAFRDILVASNASTDTTS